MAEGEEEVLAEFPGVRHKKQDGILLFTSARVAWSSGELFSVNHPYHQIKGTLISFPDPWSDNEINKGLAFAAGDTH